MDSNTRVGTCPTSAIGSHQAAKEDDREGAFSEFLSENDLFLPATFASFQDGPGDTWFHPRGGGHRIDYLGLPRQLSTLECRCWVDQFIDLGAVRDDHRPVMATVKFEIAMPTDAPRHSLRRSQLRDCTAHDLDLTLQLPWEVDVSTHAHHLQDHLERQMIDRNVQPSQNRPRKQSISDTTWELILQKKSARQSLRDAENYWLGAATPKRLMMGPSWKQHQLNYQSISGMIFFDYVNNKTIWQPLHWPTSDALDVKLSVPCGRMTSSSSATGFMKDVTSLDPRM